MSNRRLPLAAIGVSVLLWSAAYVVSGWALETTSPAVLSVGRFAIALLVLIPLVGVVMATLAAPDVEPSPPGSGLPEPSDPATGESDPVRAGDARKQS